MGVLGNLSALGVAATGISLRSAAAAAAGVWLAVLVNLPKMR